jgi:hypothetical protein
VELVVVLFIGAVLVCLWLTFLPSWREKAHRAGCENNLRQIGQAIYLFRDHTRPPALPPSRIVDHYATWAALLLPYLPQGQARGDFDTTQPYFQQPDEVRQLQVPAYYCPTRRGPGQNSTSGDVAGPAAEGQNHYPGALGDYACAAGDGDPRFPWTGANANGTLILGRILKKDPDGRILRWQGRTDIQVEKKDKVAVLRVRNRKDNDEPLAQILKGVQRGTSDTILVGEKHLPLDGFGKAEQGDGSVYNGGRPANFSRIAGPKHGLASSPSAPLDLNAPTFGSYHPGVCLFLMADGSARVITTSIDDRLLGQLVIRE